MVVVVIAGALAMAAVAAMNQHIDDSRAIEGVTMVQSIRAAQERYRAEQGQYLDVSTQGSFYPDDPSGSGGQKRSFYHGIDDDGHADNPRWHALGPTVAGPVRFGYLSNAGRPYTTMTAPVFEVAGFDGWPAATEPWYVIQAVGDLDEDGVVSYYVASSINGEVVRVNEGE